MAFELTDQGLETPRFPETRAFVVEQWRLRFGQNAQTSGDSPDGQLIDILAILLGLTWEANAEIYAGGYFRTASGNQVDLILDLFAFLRLPAEASTAQVFLAGTGGSAVPAASVIATTDTEARFATDAAVTIGDGDTTWAVRIDTAVPTATYSIEIDAVASTYVAQVGDTPNAIAGELAQAINANLGVTNATAEDSPEPDDQGRGLLAVISDGNPIAVTVTGSTTPGDLLVLAAIQAATTATATGPTPALAGTLQSIETPAVGLQLAFSTLDATLGRDLETDAAYKARFVDQRRSGGCGTPLAIRDRVLTETEATQGRVFENETELVSPEGLPPHSFEGVFLGGDDVAIAESIFRCKPAGIQAFGDIAVAVDNGQGGTVQIGFSRPVERFLHLRITVTPGEGFPTTGDPAEAIRQSVAAYYGDGGEGELQLGDDFYRFQAANPINDAVPGVASALIETADTPNPGDAPTFVDADIVVADDEILISDSSRILVIV